MSEQIGMHPDTGLYHTEHMPMPENPATRAVIERQLAGEPLTMMEKINAGRDATFTELDGIQAKPDHVYRGVDEQALSAYDTANAIVGQGEHDEFVEKLNNKGVDWYLGGIATKYGDVIIEAPASPDLFVPALDQGVNMSKDPMVRHMKSSGTENPVPLEHVMIYQKDESGTYQPRDLNIR